MSPLRGWCAGVGQVEKTPTMWGSIRLEGAVDQPEEGERGCGGDRCESQPAIGAAADAMGFGQLGDTVFSFATRNSRFFGIGVDRFAPIPLAKQMEHQIPLDFCHAFSRTLEEYRFTRHFASFAATVNLPRMACGAISGKTRKEAASLRRGNS